jgi:muramoyltetrapeptide carboxypeptidase
MIRPAFLRQGDTVSIVASGRKLDKKSIDAATAVIKSWGLNVKLSKNLFSEKHNYLSGSDAERLSDLQETLDDHSLKAIICARGGYGTTRILDQLDFKNFAKAPKWICGFSDITALHLKLQTLNVQSIHGTMPVQFSNSAYHVSAEQLRGVLFGESVTLTATSNHNRSGKIEGELIGGNLSLLAESLGTSSELQTDNKILILEEVGEYVYRLDRLLVQLKRAGKLDNLSGLVIGHMTDIKEGELPFGEGVEQLVLQHTKDFNYPVAFNFPTGHDNPNLSWIEGAHAKLVVTASQATLSF